MSLVGTYKLTTQGKSATLEINEAYIHNGDGKGKFSMDGEAVNVDIHFHYQNNSGPLICLYFNGRSDSGDMFYVGGSGSTDMRAREIDSAFGVATVKGTDGYSGKWERQ